MCGVPAGAAVAGTAAPAPATAPDPRTTGGADRPYWLAPGQRSEPGPQPLPRAVSGAQPISTGAQIVARARLWLTGSAGRPVSYDTNGCWPSGTRIPCAPPDYRADCSGYVSMALGLGASLVTGQLATAPFASPVAKDSLQQGDMMINPSVGGAGHAVLFDRWTSATHAAYWAYEQGGDGGTRYVSIPYPYWGTYPMAPYRYGGLVPAGSLSGDLGAEVVQMRRSGTNAGRLLAFTNLDAMNYQWAPPYLTASGWTDPARTRFADLNGDGRRDLVKIGSDGTLTGFLNIDAASNWWGPGRTIGTGWTDPDRVFFADLNGDGRDDLIANRRDSTLWAYPNLDAIAFNWGTARKVGDGWGDPARLFFADLNGDGRDDVLFDGYDGYLRSFPNVNALDYGWAAVRKVGSGWPDPARVLFADLTGDGRDEVVSDDADGRLWAYQNLDGINFSWGPGRLVGDGWTDPACTFLV